MLTGHRAFSAPLGSGRHRLERVRRDLLDARGELAAVSDRAPSANARTCLRRADQLLGAAAQFIAEAQLHGVDAVVEHAPPGPAELAARLATLPDRACFSTSALLRHLGLRDCTADRDRLARLLHARDWRSHGGAHAITWWTPPRVAASDPRVAASGR